MFVIAIEFRACLSHSCLARMAAPVGESTNRQLLLVSASCNADHLGEPRAPGRTLTFSCVSICAADGNFAAKGSDYRLVVRGELDQRCAYLFNGMGMKRREGMTVMEGHVRDQAQLHGLIERTQCFGLELISVERIAEAPEELR